MQFRNLWELRNFLQEKSKSDTWYSIKNAAATGERTRIDIYDEISWMGVTAQDFVKDLQAVQGDLEVHINSPGGDIFDGIAIYESLKNYMGHVRVEVDSLAASAASFIAMAGDEIIMGRNSRMMIHDGHGIAVGNAQDMRDLANLLDDASNNIADIYSQRAGGTVEEWRQRMQATTWFSAQEAVSVGLADSIRQPTQKTTNNKVDVNSNKSQEELTIDPEAIAAAFRKVIA